MTSRPTRKITSDRRRRGRWAPLAAAADQRRGPGAQRGRNLREVLPTLPPVHEVILVDGGSVDGTVETARATLPGILTVTPARRGKGNALAAGFAQGHR